MSFSGLVIRRACANDAENIIAVIDSIAAEGCWLITDTYIPTVSWERALYHSTTHRDHLLLVPETQTQIVGWCRIFPDGAVNSRTADLGIGVIKHLRCRGIGYALMLRALEWAKERSYECVTLETFATNLPAINLFLKMGFQATNNHDRKAEPEGRARLIRMERIT